jgi:hypothetical protein
MRSEIIDEKKEENPKQEWDVDRVEKILAEHGPEGLVKIFNVELSAERGRTEDAVRMFNSSKKKLGPAVQALMDIAEDTIIDNETNMEEPSLAAIMAVDFLEDMGWRFDEINKTWKYNSDYIPGLPDRG